MRISWKILAAGICLILAVGVLLGRLLAATPQSLPTVRIMPTDDPVVARIPTLLQDTHLIPSHLHASGVRREYPPLLARGLPPGGDRFWLDFQEGGGVGVLLYPNTIARDAAYRMSVDGLGDGTKPVAGIGEQSQFIDNAADPGLPEIVFMRCQVVTHARLADTTDGDLLSYARDLDQRLKPLVCR